MDGLGAPGGQMLTPRGRGMAAMTVRDARRLHVEGLGAEAGKMEEIPNPIQNEELRVHGILQPWVTAIDTRTTH